MKNMFPKNVKQTQSLLTQQSSFLVILNVWSRQTYDIFQVLGRLWSIGNLFYKILAIKTGSQSVMVKRKLLP